MVDSVRWTCPTCGEDRTTPFCARCGEEPLAAHDLTLKGLAEKISHALTNIDARALRTGWCLVRYPGRLTLAWTRGVRKTYVAPFQLFLIANLLFFALQWMTGTPIFSSTLDSHLHHQDWSELARTLVARRLVVEGLTLEQYAPVFDRAVALNARAMIVLMTVPFALLLPLVFVRQRRPLMTHVVFSLHLYAFLLLLFCVALVGAKASALLGFGGLETARVDHALSIVNILACAAYLYLAVGRVYEVVGAARILQVVLLVVAVAAIVPGYRFVIFVITLYAT